MSGNELIRCGCGGEAVLDAEMGYELYHVYCPKCEIVTAWYKTEAEAIEAWNKAMGERTAKVMSDGINYCENCEGYVEAPMVYCPYCGARLE